MTIGRESIGRDKEVAAVVESRDAVVDADQRTLDLTRLHLKPCIQQGMVQRIDKLGMRIVVTMIVRLDGNERTHRIMRRLHEKGWLQEGLALTHHIVEEGYGRDGASPDSCRDDGIGDDAGNLTQSLQGAGYGSFQQLVHSS